MCNRGRVRVSKSDIQRRPTVEPAMSEGLDPVLAKPMKPPPATRPARTKEVVLSGRAIVAVN
jgi:hypothetical protein